MGTAALFEAFDRRITIDDVDWSAAVARLVQCADALTAHYYADRDTHYTVIGSAAKETSTQPMGDADGVFHMPAGTHSRFNGYAGNGPSALLQEVRGVLAARYPRTTIRGDGPVVVVEFASGPNVEIVPGVLVSNGADKWHVACDVPVTRNGGSWESADYGAEFESMWALRTRTQGQSSRLVRYMKSWRRTQNATFKSIVIELMVADFMRTWPHDRYGYVYDDWLVRDFLGYIVDHYYNTIYTLPSGKRIDTGVGWFEDAKRSLEAAQTACGYSETSNTYLTDWKKVFGSGFGS